MTNYYLVWDPARVERNGGKSLTASSVERAAIIYATSVWSNADPFNHLALRVECISGDAWHSAGTVHDVDVEVVPEPTFIATVKP